MTAASSDRDGCRREGDIIAVDAGTNTIYADTIVVADSGKAKAGVSGKAVLGVAVEGTGDVDGSTIRIWTKGVFEFNIASYSAANLGAAVKVSDDQTVALATEGTDPASQIVGYIVAGDATAKTVNVRLGA